MLVFIHFCLGTLPLYVPTSSEQPRLLFVKNSSLFNLTISRVPSSLYSHCNEGQYKPENTRRNKSRQCLDDQRRSSGGRSHDG